MAHIGPPILSIEAAGGFSLVLCSLISCDSVPWPGQHCDFVYHYSDSWKSSDIEAMWLTYRSDNLKSKKHWRIKLVHSNNGGLYIEAQRAKGPVGLGDWKPKPFFSFTWLLTHSRLVWTQSLGGSTLPFAFMLELALQFWSLNAAPIRAETWLRHCPEHLTCPVQASPPIFCTWIIHQISVNPHQSSAKHNMIWLIEKLLIRWWRSTAKHTPTYALSM